MKPKEILVVSPEDEELSRFIHGLRAAGSLSVEIDQEEFVVEIRRAKASAEGRQFLKDGGPNADDS